MDSKNMDLTVIDCPDADNRVALLLQLLQKMQLIKAINFTIAYILKQIEKLRIEIEYRQVTGDAADDAVLRLQQEVVRERVLREELVSASAPIHVTLVGRHFSPKTSPAVVNTNGQFELEIHGPEGVQTVTVPNLKGYVVEASWEQAVWDAEAEQKLLGFYAAQLRGMLTAARIDPSLYIFYNGGVAEKAGISVHVHSMCFKAFDPRAPYCPTPGSELKAFVKEFRKMSVPERVAHFDFVMGGLTEEQTVMNSLEELDQAMAAATSIHIRLLGPATPFKYIDPTHLTKVIDLDAMAGAYDGTKNLLGTCFNQAVDLEASKRLFANVPNARVVFFPTEACKKDEFSPLPEGVLDIVMKAEMDQWREIKDKKPQPLFDVIPFIPRESLDLFTVDVVYGKNANAVGTMFEDINMTLVKKEPVTGPLTPGFYAMDDNLKEHTVKAFYDLLA
jgi:hypothetical protein